MKSEAYNASVIFCGGLRKIGKEYMPSTFDQRDEFGMLGGSIRLLSALELYFQGATDTFLFTSGVSTKNIKTYGEDVPMEALVYKNTFVKSIADLKKSDPQRLTGLNEPTIILEDKSSNTATNVYNVIQIINKHNWGKVAFVTSAYHTARLAGIVKLYRDEGYGTQASIDFLASEKIVMLAEPGKYDEEILEAYKSDAGQKRILSEANGLRDLHDGKYMLSEFRPASTT